MRKKSASGMSATGVKQHLDQKMPKKIHSKSKVMNAMKPGKLRSGTKPMKAKVTRAKKPSKRISMR